MIVCDNEASEFEAEQSAIPDAEGLHWCSPGLADFMN